MYTIEGTWVFSISMILIAAGILLAFELFYSDFEGICAVMKEMTDIAACDAADTFRIADTVKMLIGQ